MRSQLCNQWTPHLGLGCDNFLLAWFLKWQDSPNEMWHFGFLVLSRASWAKLCGLVSRASSPNKLVQGVQKETNSTQMQTKYSLQVMSSASARCRFIANLSRLHNVSIWIYGLLLPFCPTPNVCWRQCLECGNCSTKTCAGVWYTITIGATPSNDLNHGIISLVNPEKNNQTLS